MQIRPVHLCCYSLCLVVGWLCGNHIRPSIPEAYYHIITEQARRFNLEPKLVESVILTESSGKTNLVSPKGAMGLMQLMPATAAQLCQKLQLEPFSSERLLNPEINIILGCYYLSRLCQKFPEELPLALAAYNTGPARVERWRRANAGASPLDLIYLQASQETKKFVTRVLRRYYWPKFPKECS